MAFDLIIRNGDRLMKPCVIDGVSVEWTRQGAAGKMEFTVIRDSRLSFVEGNVVTLTVDGKKVFLGYVFKKDRDKDQHIKVTCYDSIIYLAKNQTLTFIENKTAKDVISELCIEVGIDKESLLLSDTKYVIPNHKFTSATSYLDIFQTLLDLTLAYSGKMFVLYDDFGKLVVKDIEEMKFTPRGALLVSTTNAENFTYESSIEDSCNEVLIYQDQGEGESKEIKEAAHLFDVENQEKWGHLSKLETIDKDASKDDARLKALQLIELHNQVKRKLSISGVFCDPLIRGGSSVVVDIELGDVRVRRWFLVESVKHTFANDYSTMDLSLSSGGGFL